MVVRLLFSYCRHEQLAQSIDRYTVLRRQRVPISCVQTFHPFHSADRTTAAILPFSLEEEGDGHPSSPKENYKPLASKTDVDGIIFCSIEGTPQ